MSGKSSIFDNQKKELGFLRIKPSLPSGSPFVERGHPGALTLNETALNLDSRGSPGGRSYVLLLILIKHLAGIADQFLYLGITYFFIMPGLFLKCSPHFLQ